MPKGKESGREPEGRTGVDSVGVPRWLPPVLLGVITILLFKEFIFSDRMLYGGDTISLGYMAREFYAQSLRSGDFPLWSPLLLGGMPFVDALASGDSLYPTSLLLLVMDPHRALGWKLVLHVFAGGLFMFGWIRSLGRSRVAALVSGVAYAVAPFLVTLVHPGHDGKLFVTALTPLLFWAMERTFSRAGLRPYVVVSAAVALVVLTTHFQLAYFLFGAAGLYYVFRAWMLWRAGSGDGPQEVGAGHEVVSGKTRRAWVALGLFLAASVAGASAAGVQLVPAFRYVTEFSRRTATTTTASTEENRLYAASWGLHPEELASYVVPEFAGNNAGGADWNTASYWGRNPFKDNHEYAGWVVLLLAFAGFLGARREPRQWFLAGLGAVALLYALSTHTPVWGLAYAILPGIRLFRAPSMVSFLFGFSAVTLAAYGVDRLLALARGGRDGSGESGARLTLALWVPTGLIGVAFVLAQSGVLFTLWTSLVYPDIDPSRFALLQAHEPFITRGLFVATALAALVAGMAFAARKGMLAPVVVAGVLTGLVFLDGFRVSAPFIQTMDFYAWSGPDPLVAELVHRQATDPPFRVASLERQGQDVTPAMHGLEMATGHHPNDFARYRELIGMEGSSMPRYVLEPNVMAVLNIQYMIVPESVGSLPEGYGGSQLVAQSQLGGQVYQSLYEFPTLPRARLVGAARVVPDEEIVPLILTPDFDPASEVILSSPPPTPLDGGPVQGEVVWEERGTDHLRLSVTSDRNALLVIADNWFPAWRATVDGEAAPVLRAYHTVRAVPVGPGEHTVELRYVSPVLRGSLALSVVAVLILLGIGLAPALLHRRERAGAEA